MKRKGKSCSDSGYVLAYATRLVFLLLVFLSATQITTTIIFMLMCRRSSRDLVLTLDLSIDPCKGQGLPAYMAFLILLVTVFGFGCVGRKATSVILFLLAICDVAVSTYLEILESNTDFETVRWDLNHTVVLCSGKDFSDAYYNFSNTSSFKTCERIHNLLYESCNVEPESIFENMHNCSSSIIQSLSDIKFRYHPISLPLTLFSSIMYMVLSILLFYIQFKDKRLPDYRRREHILHRPEFHECPTNEHGDSPESKSHLTIKLCILSVLWCQCHLLFGKKYCCGRSRSSGDNKHEVYEFEVLPTRLAKEDAMTSVTNLV